MRFLTVVALISTLYGLNAYQTVKLNTGYEMPILGLGTWQAHGAEVKQAVKDAIEIGYRHIDTASDYGNEAEVGQAIAESIKAGIIKREDLFVTTKVWPQKADAQAKALQSIHESLTKMNLTYLDLVLVHFPWDDYVGSYKGCEDAFHQKLVRSIGISNFNEQQTDNLVSKATVKPANDQIMSNPKAESAGYLKYSHSHNITVTAYSPLGTGSLVKNPKLMAIGQKHNKSAAQVMIRWQIQRGVIVIPKSVKKQYIKEDFEVFDFTLTDEEMQQIPKI